MLEDTFLFILLGVKQQQNLVKGNCSTQPLFSFPVSSVLPLLLAIEKLKKKHAIQAKNNKSKRKSFDF